MASAHLLRRIEPIKAHSVVIVVTGASAGIGRAAARAHGKQKARVGLIARGRDGLEGAKREIEESGGEAIVLPLDVFDDKAVDDAASEVEKTFGPIDIRVNNAMCSVFSPIVEMAAEDHQIGGLLMWVPGCAFAARGMSSTIGWASHA